MFHISRSFRSITGKRLFSSTCIPHHMGVSAFKPANLGKNLSQFDMLALTESPQNNIEMISQDAIVFSNLVVVQSPERHTGNILGVLLMDNQIFEVDLGKETEPDKFGLEFTQKGSMVHFKDDVCYSLLKTVFPKPELLVLGLGSRSRMLDPRTKQRFHELGIQLEISDTKAGAQSYDLLATERSPTQVAAMLLPPNL
ncbi:unnamed protein product [Kuraishia capsulata CBS 1993]|uniref:NADH dehydrogenase [ubiquinone] 1 alpha subcomplex assembly factor 3 n=1 Tax=Kuraishia capsulata CBS 1993 TaxID=1382522 RepID=W6MFJ8_9ASCO|nr:uncharacterized protein KUCA_T00000083001 [Kuraishia capsulata CBS 1993]CDK24123.1 unnamed protein product [Kuraishia capsulata CBS 1993]